jgi:hypothetical protein
MPGLHVGPGKLTMFKGDDDDSPGVTCGRTSPDRHAILYVAMSGFVMGSRTLTYP